MPIARALGWTILHSLWQIALIYPVYKGLIWAFNKHNRISYAVGLLALAGVAVWSACTFAAEYQVAAPESAEGISVAFSPDLIPVVEVPNQPIVEQSYWDALSGWFEPHAAWVGWIWCIGLCWMVIRLTAGYWLAQRLRYRGVVQPEMAFTQTCRAWADRLGIARTVQLLESPYITEPMTLGFWKPVVLFPAGLLLQLSPEQVECLLIHELAHIRRYDYLINLIQLTLEACFFYHPLFWLISREVRTRREYCCDDVVLQFTQDRIVYAHTLTTLKINSTHLQNAIAMKATGQHSFSTRIFRIAGITPKRSNRTNLFFLLLLLGAVLSAACWPVTSSASPDGNTETPALILPNTSGHRIIADSVPPKTTRPAVKTATMATPAANGSSNEDHPGGKVVAVQAAKMNVIYIGVDNPLTIAVDGTPANEILARIKNGNGTIQGANGQFNARPVAPGEAKIEIYRMLNGKEDILAVKTYRVKRIPDPVPMFSGIRRSSVVTLDQFTNGLTLEAILENFDYEAVCEIVGYEMTILPPKSDPITHIITGGKLPANIIEMVKGFTTGYAIFFDDIRVKCPGDANPRNIGGLALKIRDKE
jgi:beta-lactamase regulating signal transducer with metallopeptidase domain